MEPDCIDDDNRISDQRLKIAAFWDSIADSFDDYTHYYLKRNKWVGDRLAVLFPEQETLKIADIGTGAGFMAISMAQLGHEVVGTDISFRMLEKARANAKAYGLNITFIEDDAVSTSLPEDSFDLVIIRDVMINLWDCESALVGLSKIIRPGGYLMISDGNYFLYLTDNDFKRRQDYYVMRDGKREYERMLMLKSSDYDRLEQLVGSFHVNQVRRPLWDLKFEISLGMNNARIRCDDWEPFTVLTDIGVQKVPLRYTFSIRKPYYFKDLLPLDSHTSKMRFDSDKCTLEGISAVYLAISNIDRIRLIRCLGRGPRNVHSLAVELSLSENKTSYHLGILKDAGLVCAVKHGRETFYKQTDEAAIENMISTASELSLQRRLSE